MNAKRLEHFEKLLLAERAQIVSTLSRIAASALAPAGPDAIQGEATEAGAAGVLPTDDEAIARREAVALEQVDEALRLISESPHDYGICAQCGRPIPDARLEILPATRLCGRSA